MDRQVGIPAWYADKGPDRLSVKSPLLPGIGPDPGRDMVRSMPTSTLRLTYKESAYRN